ncbi:glycosyltransferase, partial [Streptomyces sp. NPDC055078]
MIEVLLVAAAAPRPENLTAALRTLLNGADSAGGADGGVRIRLAGFPPADALPDSELLTARHSFSAGDAARGKAFATAARQAKGAERVWLSAERDTELRSLAQRAKVIVALDIQAVYTVWQLARLNRTAHACYGVAAAARAVADRRARPGHYARAAFIASLPEAARLARTARRRAIGAPGA